MPQSGLGRTYLATRMTDLGIDSYFVAMFRKDRHKIVVGPKDKTEEHSGLEDRGAHLGHQSQQQRDGRES